MSGISVLCSILCEAYVTSGDDAVVNGSAYGGNSSTTFEGIHRQGIPTNCTECSTNCTECYLFLLKNMINAGYKGGINEFCIRECVGKQYISTGFLLSHHLPQIFLTLFGIIMNISELYIIKKRNRKKRPSEYLLISLCISDLLFCIFVFTFMVVRIVNERKEFIHHLPFFDVLVENVIQFSVLASILHVLAISFERMIAISLPLKYRAITCKRNIKKLISCLWVVTCVITATLAGIQYRDGIQADQHVNYKTASRISGVIIYVSALLLLIVYSILSYKLIRRTKCLNGMINNQPHSKNEKLKQRHEFHVIIFLVAVFVTGAFIVCTIPIATLSLLTNVSFTIECICENLLIFNSILNPIVYFWRGYWIKSRRLKKSVGRRETNKFQSTWVELVSRIRRQTNDSLSINNIETVNNKHHKCCEKFNSQTDTASKSSSGDSEYVL